MRRMCRSDLFDGIATNNTAPNPACGESSKCLHPRSIEERRQ